MMAQARTLGLAGVAKEDRARHVSSAEMTATRSAVVLGASEKYCFLRFYTADICDAYTRLMSLLSLIDLSLDPR